MPSLESSLGLPGHIALHSAHASLSQPPVPVDLSAPRSGSIHGRAG